MPNQTGALVLVGGIELPRVAIPEDMPGPKDQCCKTFKTWANYAMSYRKRYKAWPVWNSKVGGQLGLLIGRLGIDVAHSVAAYYVSINDAVLMRKCHPLGDLLANAESYHTQWATQTQVTGTTARQAESTQANVSAMEQALAAQRERRANNAQ